MKPLIKFFLFTILVLNVVNAYAAVPDLSVGSSSGFPGQTVTIPVTADFDQGYISMQFDVKYDPALLTPTTVSLGKDVTGWSIVSNPNTSGLIRIGMYNTGTITGTGKQVANITFTVNNGPGTLANPNLTLSNAIFDTKNITSLTGGSFFLSLYGDVNGDGTVSLADVTQVAQSCVGLTTLTTAQTQAGDVNGDGILNMYDAALIAQYVAKIITKLH